MKKTITTFVTIFALAFVGVAHAGTLYPTTQPGETMYSLQELYDLIVDSTESIEGAGEAFQAPDTTEKTQVTLVDLYNAIKTLKEDPEAFVQLHKTKPNLFQDKYDGKNTEQIWVDLTGKTSYAASPSYSKGVQTFQFTVVAFDEDIFIPVEFNTDYLKFNNKKAEEIGLTSTLNLRGRGFVTSQDGYYRIPKGTYRQFILDVNTENVSNADVTFKPVIVNLEYKVGSTDSTMQIYQTAAYRFFIDNLTLKAGVAPVAAKVLNFEVEVEESDFEVEEIKVTEVVATTTEDTLEDIVTDIVLEIEGETASTTIEEQEDPVTFDTIEEVTE